MGLRYNRIEAIYEGETMPHSHYSGEEIDRRGDELYERSLRTQVEIEDNIGKIMQQLAQVEQIRAQMQRDQAEIEALGARTDVRLAQMQIQLSQLRQAR